MWPRIDAARLETAFAVAQRLLDTRSLPSAVLAVATSRNIVLVEARLPIPAAPCVIRRTPAVNGSRCSLTYLGC
jgi:hypothetical protein